MIVLFFFHFFNLFDFFIFNGCLFSLFQMFLCFHVLICFPCFFFILFNKFFIFLLLYFVFMCFHWFIKFTSHIYILTCLSQAQWLYSFFKPTLNIIIHCTVLLRGIAVYKLLHNSHQDKTAVWYVDCENNPMFTSTVSLEDVLNYFLNVMSFV